MADVAAQQQEMVNDAWAQATRSDGSVDMEYYNAMAQAINEWVSDQLAALQEASA